MTDELNQNQEVEEKPDTEESSEEKPSEEVSEEKPEETSEEATEKETKEEVSQEAKPQTPDEEALNLFKSVREEVGEKRFDGLMSAWQKDRTELKKLQDAQKPTEDQQQKSDDALVDYLDKRLEEKRVAKEEAIQEAVRAESDEVRTMYPQFTEKQLLETANELSSRGKPASLMTSALHLAKLDEAVKTKQGLASEEAKRKKEAGNISGRSGYQTSPGVREFNPEKDSGKSFAELIDEGKSELGIK